MLGVRKFEYPQPPEANLAHPTCGSLAPRPPRCRRKPRFSSTPLSVRTRKDVVCGRPTTKTMGRRGHRQDNKNDGDLDECEKMNWAPAPLFSCVARARARARKVVGGKVGIFLKMHNICELRRTRRYADDEGGLQSVRVGSQTPYCLQKDLSHVVRGKGKAKNTLNYFYADSRIGHIDSTK